MKKFILTELVLLLWTTLGFADGFVRPPKNYKGSLEERSQEAIIVFTPGTESKSATQDLIIKIKVEGEGVDNFGWIVPLPNAPKTAKAKDALFKNCFDYVQARSYRPKKANKAFGGVTPQAMAESIDKVEVISREVVGSFDVAVVRETEDGALNKWLEEEGFMKIPDTKEAKALLKTYREKKYVFACVKVNNVNIKGSADLHPLRFTFETGGRDGIYFPMRITGLQTKPFNVNLYIFYQAWVNDRINRYGYTNRGFSLKFRDYDSRSCKPNAGKAWWDPKSDRYLSGYAGKIDDLSKFFNSHHKGKHFYLTNIQAYGLKPKDVLKWEEDLWLFPYYTTRSFVPYDARKGAVASGSGW